MSANNIVVADFTGGIRKTTAATLWQYDYGQILQFNGIDLPVSLIEMFPYVATIVAVAVLGRRALPPAEDGRPLAT